MNAERQSFKCWVCDLGGDVFSFVMKMEGVGFPEALAMLADRANISLEPAAGADRPSPADDKRVLYQAMAWADAQYHECLLNDAEAAAARNYLASAASRPNRSATSSSASLPSVGIGSRRVPRALPIRAPCSNVSA